MSVKSLTTHRILFVIHFWAAFHSSRTVDLIIVAKTYHTENRALEDETREKKGKKNYCY